MTRGLHPHTDDMRQGLFGARNIFSRFYKRVSYFLKAVEKAFAFNDMRQAVIAGHPG